ncbi:MAG: 4-(cytidine 5'-diphospho)-2-C-methyl-D-erythritol kinase [Vicinamibacterales bacterium]
MRACTALAFAKLNLDLRVLGVRADGYHELHTVFQSIALADRVTCRAIDGPLTLTADDPSVPTDSSNLAWKAAVAVWRAAGRPGVPEGVHIALQKRIPSSAGLGGGSADAAVTTRLVSALWQVSLDPLQERRVLSSLGADVPFFAVGGTAVGSGRGEDLTPVVSPPPMWVVVAMPDFGVSTAEAYRWFDELAPFGRADVVASPPGSSSAEAWNGWLGRCRNDLQAPVVARHPRIGELVDHLTSAGATLAAMSGSGAAVFGLFPESSAASRARSGLDGGGTRTWLTKTLGREEAALAVELL